MKKIYLSVYKKDSKTNGLFATVDNDDYARLSKYNWTAAVYKTVTYAVRSTPRDKTGKQKTIRMHNEILGSLWVDHIDRNGLNNTKKNLRRSCPKTNSWNRVVSKNKKNKYIGVSRSGKNKYRARIKIDGKLIHLGISDSELDCAKMYNDAAIKRYGKFAVINKIP